MKQPNLFVEAIRSRPLPEVPPYQRHSPTSRASALRVAPGVSTLRLQVLTFIRESGTMGATDDEMQVTLSMDPSTQRPRRVELVRAGWVIDSGRKRATRSGRAAVVWREKEANVGNGHTFVEDAH